MEVYEFQDYRRFLKTYIRSLPQAGRGVPAKLAKRIGVHPSLITQVMNEQRDFTQEQALDVAIFFGLSSLEIEYWLLLVQMSRAGTPQLRLHLKKQLAEVKERSRLLKERLPAQDVLSEEAKAVFYSQWYYSGLRILTSIDEYQTVEALCEKLRLPRVLVQPTLDFLVRYDLCEKLGPRYKMGVQSTHLGSDSPLVARHHVNWRNKAIEKISTAPPGDALFFTSPLSLAKADIEKVRNVLVKALEEIFKIVDPSPAEEAVCLNFDFFRY